MAVLAEKLKEEVEDKRILPPSKKGFRKEIGTIDQIYVVNFMISKRVTKKIMRIVLSFIDMKAAFNSVDRENLVGNMGKKLYSLAYADDVALLAEDEGRLKGMLKIIEMYVEEKRLKVNVEKTKAKRCKTG